VLDDHERETLSEIQRRLLGEDPKFAQSFDADARHLRRAAPDLSRRTYTTMLVITSGFGVTLLLAGSPFIALLFAVLTIWVWHARSLRLESDREQS
jgi:hypothetical protein